MAKYLDEKGLQHLWSKISMEDYPNNETLIAILNAIDQTKMNKDVIPEVTSANDGQFLRVVSGKWAAVTLPNAEEASF